MSFEAIPTILQAILDQTVKNGQLLERLYADTVSVNAVAVAESNTEQKAVAAEPKVEAPAPTKTEIEQVSVVTDKSVEVQTHDGNRVHGNVVIHKEIEVAVPDVISYADVSKLILKVSSTKGRDTAVAILGKFGAANLKEVKPEQYAEVVAAANEVLGG